MPVPDTLRKCEPSINTVGGCTGWLCTPCKIRALHIARRSSFTQCCVRFLRRRACGGGVPIHSARVRPFGAERPLMFAYYGTRGALPKLTLDLAREASGRWNNACTFSLATSNELYDEFSFMQDNLFAVNTFASPQQWQSITCVQRVKSLCADLSERVANDKTRAIVSLMPDVWASFLFPCIRCAV